MILYPIPTAVLAGWDVKPLSDPGQYSGSDCVI